MTSHPSSIGSVEPVYDAHNDRVKGISQDYETAGDSLAAARNTRDAHNAARLSVRFIAPDVFPCNLTVGSGYVGGFETRPVPLSGAWKGFFVHYFGENRGERVEPSGVLAQENLITSESLRTAKRSDPVSKAGQNGYGIEIAHGVRSDADVRKLHGLYTTVYQDYVFPLTPENVAKLVQNPDSVTVFARSRDGMVSSVAVAEVVEIPTRRGLLRISEISDEATLPGHAGNGLNQACVHTAAQELLKLYGDDIHLIYAENRAVSRGVNQQSANLGWLYAGRLNRPCRIKAAGDIIVEGPYEDLNVWYYPR